VWATTRHRPGGGGGAGAVRAADHRDHRLFVCRSVLSKKRTATALAQLFGTPVSEGTVATMTSRAAEGLGEFLDQVKHRLIEAQVVGFDETKLRVAGRLHWVHCARTGKYTLITCHAKRGRVGIDDAGVLSSFRGIAVHDAWAPYDSYLDVEHQLRCAHVLRELAAVADTASDADWCWANQAADALVTMQQLVAEAIAAGADTLDPDVLAIQIQRYRSAAQLGICQTCGCRIGHPYQATWAYSWISPSRWWHRRPRPGGCGHDHRS
jgi:transposase